MKLFDLSGDVALVTLQTQQAVRPGLVRTYTTAEVYRCGRAR